MRSIAVIILIIYLSAAFMQPMIETANICKEKVVLGAAILNSCRAASKRALSEDELRDLDAKIDPKNFADYFAEAFGDTLSITQDGPSIVSGETVSMSFSTTDERWDKIDIVLEFQNMVDIDSYSSYTLFDHYDLGYNAAILDIYLTTPYVFRTYFLKKAIGALTISDYNLTEKRQFVVRVLN